MPISVRTVPLLLAIAVPVAWAQQPAAPSASPSGPPPASRAAEIEAAREQKSRQLAPDEVSGFERRLNTVKEQKLLERLSEGVAGVRVVFGNLPTGSGFGIGPEYLRRDLAGGKVIFRAAAIGSTRAWYRMESEVDVPRFGNGWLYFHGLARHFNYAGINYYGPGPDSEKTGRSNYRYEGDDYTASFGLRPYRHVRLGVNGSLLRLNVGPGTDDRFISTDLQYSPRVTPGIDRQSHFLRGGVLAQYDSRDNPLGARRGGNYYAQLSYYGDRDLGRHNFRRLDLEAQQYVPFFNERRVIALRAKTVLTYANGRTQSVPFYLQPILGGSDDLRGYRPFRFYDDNLLVMNAEYRWETFSGLDMALFADAGKVFRRRSQLDFNDLESAVGFGFRFNARNQVFLRIDVGFSHEGYQVWLKFNNVF